MAINAEEFVKALEAIEVTKGISREVTLKALEEAMIRGYRKQLGGDDANVKVNIDPEKGIIEMFNVKIVKKEVEDDFLEISLEDAQKVNKNYKPEDEFLIPAPIADLRKATAMSIKSILRQKFSEAEKNMLYENFKDKLGTMITGKVETSDEHGCSVTIGRNSIYLSRSEMIGDEKFNPGDSIRLYVSSVENNEQKGGAHVTVSRSDEGFVKALFFEEIREIYDGTIVIKNISRRAGERSKVAVWSNDPNVDPAGACIGPNGTRIQKIVSQLGNGSSKEKIDIISYSDNGGLYVMESLKPARVVGIIFSSEDKTATAIVKDDSLSLAIGRRGCNASLASKLTGYHIDIKTETEAVEAGLTYQTLEELQSIDLENKARLAEQLRAEQYQKFVNNNSEVLPGLPEGYVAPQSRVYAEETNDFDETLAEKLENEEIKEEVEISKPVAPKEETKANVTAPKEEPVVEEHKTVRTTTTISDLEKSLESESSKGNKKPSYKKPTHKKKDEEEEETSESSVTKPQDPKTYMSIYTEEELRQMEEEDKDNDDIEEEDEIDYDDYDQYYDEGK